MSAIAHPIVAAVGAMALSSLAAATERQRPHEEHRVVEDLAEVRVIGAPRLRLGMPAGDARRLVKHCQEDAFSTSCALRSMRRPIVPFSWTRVTFSKGLLQHVTLGYDPDDVETLRRRLTALYGATEGTAEELDAGNLFYRRSDGIREIKLSDTSLTYRMLGFSGGFIEPEPD